MDKRKRTVYLILSAITIPLGLSTRKYGSAMPGIIAEFGGDVLYATFVFFLIRFLAVKWSLQKVAFFAYLFCICIETFQLYRAPWIEAVRHTFPFGLILGFGFLWSDWVCYAVGVFIALAVSYPLERAISKRNNKIS